MIIGIDMLLMVCINQANDSVVPVKGSKCVFWDFGDNDDLYVINMCSVHGRCERVKILYILYFLYMSIGILEVSGQVRD